MGLYARYVLPHVVNFACTREANMRQRGRVVPLAWGTVLEIGIGSGLNLPFYEPGRVQRIWGVDPSPEMWALARKRAERLSIDCKYIEAGAEEVPLADESVDSVVVTYSLCTIPEPLSALAEMRRVLRPGGSLVFCEHGLAPDERVRRWQHRLNPVWRCLGGGCNLNRDVPALLQAGGFRPRDMHTKYLPGWRPASFNYWGTCDRES